MSPPPEDAARTRGPRSGRALIALASWLAIAAIGFVALGIWQVERRAWKLDLIARVDARIHAAPTLAPGPAEWSEITQATDEYRRVRARGVYLNDRETAVEAVTVRGAGFWIVTPFRTDRGFVVLVNRGFAPPDERTRASRLAREIDVETEVTGLLRLTEPGGGFLRGNDPARDRWYSRDVAAIARARRLGTIAPYFIDADAAGAGAPIGGLTIVTFPNNHLLYALTWFALAAMSAAACARLIHDERASRRRRDIQR